ncbi:hypothetical protein [Flavobacterium sharifuzzamanii]|uniref:hypothetical protein n=1 Tax=Flavobacterium sharifuzzamanii TaxID=2211133 RepID=UPI000DACC972|nr:hypothetical protein [Flavobacterium sharifuzzamanii]KAF2079240.1 hypothetical protein DMA14_22435 [Flavobacterium sharifuzzamanii]
MEAIRQIISVKNHSVTVVLPDDFTAEKVEVIILPVQNDEYQVPQWQIDQVRERTENYLRNPKNVTDIDDFLKEIEDEL